LGQIRSGNAGGTKLSIWNQATETISSFDWVSQHLFHALNFIIKPRKCERENPNTMINDRRDNFAIEETVLSGLRTHSLKL
jgi:hypothetical protein